MKRQPLQATPAPAPTFGVDAFPVEVEEVAEGFRMRVYAPGMDRARLDIDVTKDSVDVQGVTKAGIPATLLPSQFTVSRKFMVELDPHAAAAAYEDGVLEIVIPRAQTSRRAKLSVL